MKRLLLFMVCLVLLSGCIEKKHDKENAATNEAGMGLDEKIIVTISSPRPGEIIKADQDVSFEATAKGGKEPYGYSWSSNINGALSKKSSFLLNPSELGKGQHTITATVTDANGRSGRGSVRIYAV
jgi:hypothetical protein